MKLLNLIDEVITLLEKENANICILQEDIN